MSHPAHPDPAIVHLPPAPCPCCGTAEAVQFRPLYDPPATQYLDGPARLLVEVTCGCDPARVYGCLERTCALIYAELARYDPKGRL